MGELASLAVPGLFPEIEPRGSGMLRLDAVHTMYWRRAAMPAGSRGFPARRPGCGEHAEAPAFFRSGAYRIIVYDQRGRGVHPPSGTARQHHTASGRDLEILRVHLRVERWSCSGLLGQYTGDRLRGGAPGALPRSDSARNLPLPQKRDRVVSLRAARSLSRALEKFAGFLPVRSVAICSAIITAD